MTTTNQLSTPLSLTSFMQLVKTVPNKDSTAAEVLNGGATAIQTMWLANLGVLENTYSFTYGATEDVGVALTDVTDYVLDLDLSKITFTTVGINKVSATFVYAQYKFNQAGILNSELLSALNAAENRILQATEQTFADGTVSNPAYHKVSNELIQGHSAPQGKVYDLKWVPVVKIDTTSTTAYTTGGTTITLTTASGLPTTGTIYIGGNKVAYTGRKNTADLIIPATTPSITAASVVRGDVIEVSQENEGTLPSFVVLRPELDYTMDFDQGRFKIYNSAYWGELIGTNDFLWPSNYQIRATYMAAWHELGAAPTIPDEIQFVVNAYAARRLKGSIMAKANMTGLNDFNPSTLDVDDAYIQTVIDEYQTLNVGTSPYNKQSLS